jgi:hypothetical protein
MPQDADRGQHHRAAALRHQDQRFHGGLPVRQGKFRLGQLADVLGGISEGDERPPKSLKRTRSSQVLIAITPAQLSADRNSRATQSAELLQGW